MFILFTMPNATLELHICIIFYPVSRQALSSQIRSCIVQMRQDRPSNGTGVPISSRRKALGWTNFHTSVLLCFSYSPYHVDRCIFVVLESILNANLSRRGSSMARSQSSDVMRQELPPHSSDVSHLDWESESKREI